MAKVGFDWSDIGGVLKIDEEKQELIEAIKTKIR